MALADLSDRGLVEKRDADDPANYPQKHYELTPEGVRLVNQHRADVDDSVRVLA